MNVGPLRNNFQSWNQMCILELLIQIHLERWISITVPTYIKIFLSNTTYAYSCMISTKDPSLILHSDFQLSTNCKSITYRDLKVNLKNVNFTLNLRQNLVNQCQNLSSWQKNANLREIVPPIVRSGDQMVTANLREPPTSNPPIARTYCI